MAREKEIKIRLKIPFTEFLQRLEAVGYQDKGSNKQKDIYFDTKDWFLYNSIAALRIRIVNDQEHSFAFKKVFYLPGQRNKYYVEEIELPFPVFEEKDLSRIFAKVNLAPKITKPLNHLELTEILTKGGYFGEQKVLKTRREFVLEDKSLTIDDIENVGTIIELECKDSDPIEETEKLLKEQEWEDNSTEGIGYIWLRNVKGFTKHLENYKRFETEPDWNVWESEKEFYKNILTK